MKPSRKYIVIDTKKPYLEGEYPSGGFEIYLLDPDNDKRHYIDNSPDRECLHTFFKAISIIHDVQVEYPISSGESDANQNQEG